MLNDSNEDHPQVIDSSIADGVSKQIVNNETGISGPMFPIRTDKAPPEKRTDLTAEEKQSRWTDCNNWCWDRLGYPGHLDNCSFFQQRICRGLDFGRYGNFFDFWGGTCSQFHVVGSCSQCMYCVNQAAGRNFPCRNNILNDLGSWHYGVPPGYYNTCPF